MLRHRVSYARGFCGLGNETRLSGDGMLGFQMGRLRVGGDVMAGDWNLLMVHSCTYHVPGLG